MELTKFIHHAIHECVKMDLKKTTTKTHITNFLNRYDVKHLWEKDTLKIDQFFFRLSFNTKGICRGFSVGEIK